MTQNVVVERREEEGKEENEKIAFEVPGQNLKFDAKTVARVARAEAGVLAFQSHKMWRQRAACPSTGPKTLL